MSLMWSAQRFEKYPRIALDYGTSTGPRMNPSGVSSAQNSDPSNPLLYDNTEIYPFTDLLKYMQSTLILIMITFS